jgi:Holliday junction resolvase-like predicted endonuclease
LAREDTSATCKVEGGSGPLIVGEEIDCLELSDLPLRNLGGTAVASQNIGEEIAGLYLQIERGCDFVQYNINTPDVQGEIDVIAINFREQVVYVCEVAIHLVTGLQYVKDAQPDTTDRLIRKFVKDIDYAEKAFPDYKRVFMLWSPIVRASGPNAKHDQMKAVEAICSHLAKERDVKIELIINERYKECLLKLRDYAAKKTEELKSPVLRLFQIEALLDRYLDRKLKKSP